MSDTLPTSSAARKYTVPFAVNVIGCEYVCQVLPSRLYSFTAESSLKTPVTITSPPVGSVMLGDAVGATGASLSMLSTV